MNSVLDIRELLDSIMEIGRLSVKATACSLMLVDEQQGEPGSEATQGEALTALQTLGMPMEAGIAGWIAARSRPVVIRALSMDSYHYELAERTSSRPTHAVIGAPLLARGKLIGVIEATNKLDGSSFDEDDWEVLAAIASAAAIAIDNARLCRVIPPEGLGGQVDAIQSLAAAVDAKDPHTSGHSEPVTQYCSLAAEGLLLAKEDREALRRAAVLRDVGKIGIDGRILRKPVPLSPEEWEVMCTHAEKGSRIVESIEFLAEAKPAIHGHHERFDGTGYPDGLRREEIPMGARIIAVADSFDAMTTDRPYRESLGFDFALSELKRGSGTQFDPEVAAALMRAIEAKTRSRI